MISTKLSILLALAMVLTLSSAVKSESSQFNGEDNIVIRGDHRIVDPDRKISYNPHDCCECDDDCLPGPFGDRECCNGLCKYRW